ALSTLELASTSGPFAPPLLPPGTQLAAAPSFGLLRTAPASGARQDAERILAAALAMLFPPSVPEAASGPVQAAWLLPWRGASMMGWVCADGSPGGLRRAFRAQATAPGIVS